MRFLKTAIFHFMFYFKRIIIIYLKVIKACSCFNFVVFLLWGIFALKIMPEGTSPEDAKAINNFFYYSAFSLFLSFAHHLMIFYYDKILIKLAPPGYI